MQTSPISEDDFDPVSVEGVVAAVSGLGVEIEDRLGVLEVGSRVAVDRAAGPLVAEVAGVSNGFALCLPLGSLEGVRRGARARFLSSHATAAPSEGWLGRVVNGLGEPIDGKGPLPRGRTRMKLRAAAPSAPLRARLGQRIDYGVRALNAFAMARAGQRLGVFSAAGLGKSALLGMIARNFDCDVSVIAMIGERGREVREFIEDSLGPARLARSVVVVATSDEPALMRREAAFLAMTVAEYFRDRSARGPLHVLLMMDSITRIAAAQREIGLAAGEPPATRGLTPSVFSLLPAILERAGPGPEAAGGGAITGMFSVLVEGDDHDEPVADAARAILDGHIVLDRKIAERGRYPAIDILRSLSRTMPEVAPPEIATLIARARALAARYEDMREMIAIGAYREGANLEVDLAIAFYPHLERFLNQSADEIGDLGATFAGLAGIAGEGEGET